MIEEIDEVETVAELRRRIYYYRMAGELVDVISEKLGVPARQVVKFYREFVNELAERATMDTPDSARQLEIDRLDTLMNAHWDLATSTHEVQVVLGTGSTKRIETISQPPDPRAAKVVLEALAMRTRLTGMDGNSSTDPSTVQNILIVGNDQKSYLEALASGRQQVLNSARPDNEIDGKVVG